MRLFISALQKHQKSPFLAESQAHFGSKHCFFKYSGHVIDFRSHVSKQCFVVIDGCVARALFRGDDLTFSFLVYFFNVELPGAPSNLVISKISSRSATLKFRAGEDGKTTISKWIVEGQVSCVSFIYIYIYVNIPISILNS